MRINGGKVQVALTIDSAPADASKEEDVDWKKTIVIDASDVERI